MKEVYRIVALPENKSLKILNEIQNYLYMNWFRYENKNNENDIHITLTQTLLEKKEINLLQQKIRKEKISCEPFILSCSNLVNEYQDRVKNDKKLQKKYPNWSHRIALFFEKTPLKELAKKLVLIQKQLNVDDTEELVKRIKTIKQKNIQTKGMIDHIANHLNLCNYTLPQKANEAIEYIKTKLPKEIIIDTIWLRSYDKKILWKITL